VVILLVEFLAALVAAAFAVVAQKMEAVQVVAVQKMMVAEYLAVFSVLLLLPLL
jgi:hypothetical protein